MLDLKNHNSRPPLGIPSWEELCSSLYGPSADASLSDEIAALTAREQTLVYRSARHFVTHALPGVCYQKFLNFPLRQTIELIADQAVRNRQLINELEHNSARRASMVPVTGRFDSRVFRPHAQLPCTQETSQLRVERALSMLDHDARILLLGDDDLVSVSLAQAGFRNVTAVDIDPRVIKSIKKINDAEGHDIRFAVHDLRKPAPKALIDDYDMVFFDPEYSQEGLELFTSAALNFTRERSGCVYFMSLHLMSLMAEGVEIARNFLGQVGVELLSFDQGFNIYPVPARLRALIHLVNQVVLRSRTLGAEGWTLPYFMSDAIVLRKT